MKPEQDNFEGLRRLLKLKRHEKPPPGYFENFSSNVIAEIKARGNQSSHENLIEWISYEAPWLARLMSAFETNPLASWATGAAVCAVIIGAVVYTQSAQFSPVSNAVGVADTSPLKPASVDNPSAFAAPQEAQTDANGTNSAGSLFDQIQPQTQPAGWHP